MKIEIEKPVVPQWFDDWYKTFDGNKPVALYHLNRTGWGYGLTDDNDCEVDDFANKLKDLIGDSSYRDAQEYLSKAILLGYEVKKEPLYYAKNKLTGQYLGNKDIGIGSCVPQPYWVSNKLCFQVEKLPKKVFKRVYGLDKTNADFEEVG